MNPAARIPLAEFDLNRAKLRVRLAWVIFGIQIALLVTALAFDIANWSTPVNFDVRLGMTFGVLVLAFAVVAVALSVRRPMNPVGWSFSAIASLMIVSGFFDSYATYTLATNPGSLPWGRTASWLSSVTQGLEFVAPLALIFLTFPSGKLLSWRWKPLVRVIAAGLLLLLLNDMFGQDELNSSVEIDNPYRIAGLASLLATLGTLGFLLLLASLALGIAALVMRFRAAKGVERQQLKWLAYSATIFTIIITILAAPLFWYNQSVPSFAWLLLFFSGLATVPISAGIAILRYRLFDIDVIINRTIVYGSLVVLLATAYIGTVVVLQGVLSSLASGSDLAVAASTLLVAGIFRPARSRVQRAVDRRFYRQKYDAARTVANFSARLRDEVDLDSLVNEIRVVVGDTMQPRHVSVWLAVSGSADELQGK